MKIGLNSQQLTPLQREHLQKLYMRGLLALYHQLLASFSSINTSGKAGEGSGGRKQIMIDMHSASVALTSRAVPINQDCHWETEEL